ncbi:MAG: amidohydrolase family protein [Coriobacteriia bacterium]|nr:amidohydrolase family protein [Coriobacteriia bacterium]MBN2822450.1 amidohydrolase family protein [Coriobacteriia bacterium]
MLLLARYVLPVSSAHIEDGGVLVKDGAIVAVGPRAEMLSAHPDEEVRDYGLAALMPGFIDLHTHFEYSAFRGVVDDLPYTQWKLQVLAKEALLDDQDWRDSSILGAIEAIRSGITTFADISDSGASVDAAARSGLRGVLYREISTMDKRQVEAEMASAIADMDLWRAKVDDSLITIGIAPHSPYSCHPTLFQAVADYVAETDTPVAIHLAGSKDEYDFVKYGSSMLGQEFRDQAGWSEMLWMPTGVSPVQYLHQWGLMEVANVMAVHCVHVDDADIDILASNGVAIAHCPRCNLKLGMGIAPLHSFVEKDICVGIGTDSPASNSTIDFFDEMRVGLLTQRGIGGETAYYTGQRFVRMATLGGAQALKIDHLVGTIEVGKRADIIAVDLSQNHQVPTQDPYGALVHTANQEDVLMTMVDGRILFEEGRVTTLDPEEISDALERVRVKLRD